MNTPHILFGGSFDPVHNAHIALAQNLGRMLNSQVTLLPAYLSPLKNHAYSTSAQRLHMLQLAIRDIPQIIIDTRELAKQKTSYTIDTLRQYRQNIKDKPLLFVMGMDSFNHFDQWKDWHAFLTLCHIIIADRANHKLKNITMMTYLEKYQTTETTELLNKPAGHIWHYPFEAYKISSTDIRHGLSQSPMASFVSDVVNTDVLTYIKNQKLYSSC